MSLDTLFPHQPTLSAILPNRQGRSKKQLKPVIEHDGRVFVARFEGRPGRFFGAYGVAYFAVTFVLRIKVCVEVIGKVTRKIGIG